MRSAGAGAGVAAAAGGAPAHAARAKQSATATHLIGAQATTRPFDPSICPIDWRAIPYDDLPLLRPRQRRRRTILHGLREAADQERGCADTHPARRRALGLLDDMGTPVKRYERHSADTTIGRRDGDIRFPDDPFISPLHAKLSWEADRLVVRDLGSRNGTWVFLEGPHRLVDGD